MSILYQDLKIRLYHPFLMERILKYGVETEELIILKDFLLLDNIWVDIFSCILIEEMARQTGFKGGRTSYRMHLEQWHTGTTWKHWERFNLKEKI